jgi:hypothetical protein
MTSSIAHSVSVAEQAMTTTMLRAVHSGAGETIHMFGFPHVTVVSWIDVNNIEPRTLACGDAYQASMRGTGEQFAYSIWLGDGIEMTMAAGRLSDSGALALAAREYRQFVGSDVERHIEDLHGAHGVTPASVRAANTARSKCRAKSTLSAPLRGVLIAASPRAGHRAVQLAAAKRHSACER